MTKSIDMKKMSVFKNIPVGTRAIATLFSGLVSENRKVANLEKEGAIIRLKKGLYVVNPEESGILLSMELIANHLYSPSYVSMLSALRYHGLIPERVEIVQSMTTHLTKEFTNALGRFEYHHCDKDYYHIGVEIVQSGDVNFMIAKPEKALCDYISYMPNLNLRFFKETYTFLEEDLRFDMDRLVDMDLTVFNECAEKGKKKHIFKNIIKIIENERNI